MVHQDLSTRKWLSDFGKMLIFWFIGLVLFEIGLWAFLILCSMVLRNIGDTPYTFLDIRSSTAFFSMACSAVAFTVSYIIRGQERSSISIKIENFTDYELTAHIAYCNYIKDNKLNHNIISNKVGRPKKDQG